MNTEFLYKSLDLASIATWIMIIGFAVLLFVTTYKPTHRRASHTARRKSAKKV